MSYNEKLADIAREYRELIAERDRLEAQASVMRKRARILALIALALFVWSLGLRVGGMMERRDHKCECAEVDAKAIETEEGEK